MKLNTFLTALAVGVLLGLFNTESPADELKVGAAVVDITPSGTVYIAGWSPYRVSKGVETPLKANIIALETVGNNGKSEMAVIISFDLISIRAGLMLPLRKAIGEKFPKLDLEKFLFHGTHTHCAPVLNDPVKMDEGIMKPSEYVKEIVPKIIDGIGTAWNGRQKATFSYGLGNAVVAQNRISVYTGGSGAMYGDTSRSSFRVLESVEDHEVGSMFFWNSKDQPIAMIVNVACPAQENERHNNCYLSSDYWGKVRDLVQKKYGQNVVVAGLCSAAGDTSPHQRYHLKAHARMVRLRKVSETEEIARRIFQGIEEVYPLAYGDRKADIVMKHRYTVLTLPQRVPTQAEYESAVAANKNLTPNTTTYNGNRKLIERYEDLAKDPKPVFKTPVNVLRIGDTVLCTNQFEYYTEYGIQLKAKSPAVQTFVAQLTNGSKNFDTEDPASLDITHNWGSAGSYLPGERGVKGNAYGGMVRTNIVGPKGGQMIVDETLKIIKELW